MTERVRGVRQSQSPGGTSGRVGRCVAAAACVSLLSACAVSASGTGHPPSSAAGIGTSVPAPAGSRCPSPGGPATSGHTGLFGSLVLPCLRAGPSAAMDRLGGRLPVLVNLWASWCRPCQREMPRLQRASLAVGRRMLVLGVDSLDSTDSARSFLTAIRATYPQVVDTDGKARTQIRAVGLPATIVLRPDGTVAYRKVGELSPQDLSQALASVGIELDAADLK